MRSGLSLWPLLALAGCDQDGDGWAWPEDCDDRSVLAHPGAHEFCGGVDEDCDGKIDNSAVGVFYQDLDADGQGDPSQPYTADQCEAPAGLINDARDCDDLNPAIFDGAVEYCNGVDDDCDGLTDDADPSASRDDMTTYYLDEDQDGYAGDRSETLCNSVASEALFATDCNDANIAQYPGAPEVCDDGVVNDCDNPDAEVCGYTRTRTVSDVAARYLGQPNAPFGGAFILADLNQDGLIDLLAGAEDISSGRGAVWVELGPLIGGRTLGGASAGDPGRGLGSAVAEAGDLDGDGMVDFIVGAKGEGSGAGAIYGMAGALTIDFPATATFSSAGGPGQGAGWGLLGPGDTNGDAVPELLVVGHGAGGAAYLWHVEGLPGDELGAPQTSDDWTSGFGSALEILGDVDGDGLTDVGIGDPDASRIWLALGGEPELTEGLLAADGCGAALAGVGDADGDGLAEIATACSLHRSEVTVPLYQWDGHALGKIGAVIIEQGDASGGVSLAALADVNGDGAAEVALGLPGADPISGNEGTVTVLMSPLLAGDAGSWTIRGGTRSSQLGRRIAAADVTGDGLADLMVEAGFARGTPSGTSSLNLFPYESP